MLTLKPNAKLSTFAQLMELEVWPSTASSVLMVHSSTRTTSSVTGGSTLTAPLLRISTLSMMKLLLNVKLLQELLQMLLVLMELLFKRNMQLLLTTLNMKKLLLKLFQFMKLLLLMNQKSDHQGSWEEEETTGEETQEEAGEEQGEVKPIKHVNSDHKHQTCNLN